MSIVKGETRRYYNFQLALGRLAYEISAIGKEIRSCRTYDAINNSYRLTYHVGCSKVLLIAREEKYVFKSSFVIAGKDHLKTRKKISEALKKVDMENIKVESYKPK